jgi:hypothetical protein
MGEPNVHDDVAAIENLVVESQYLIDSGGWSRLAEEVFATERDGVVPEADFGFAVWRGSAEIHAGFGASMARFDACMHAVTNVYVSLRGDEATARYYVQGWHWVRSDEAAIERNADFLVLGVMTDELVRQEEGWRVRRRHLVRVGPDVAVGALPPFLSGLGS